MKSKHKFLLVINPISGGSDKDNLQQEIDNTLNDHKISYTTYKTTGDDDVAQIRKLLDSQNITTVLVAGGDGTVQMAAKAIDDRAIAISLIPAGSANGLASNLNLPDSIAAQVDIALGKDYMMMDVIYVNDHLCLHIADLGINAALIKNYESSDLRGKLGYALQTIPTLIQSNLPYGFTLEIEGKTHHHEGVMVAIANAPQFGTGAVINPEGKMDDGLFEVLVFKNLDIIDILKTLNKDSERNPEFVESFSTTKAVITSEKPIPFQIDGEYIGDVKRVSAALRSSKLKIMVPKTD